MHKRLLCIEAGAGYISISHRSPTFETVHFPLSPDAFGDATAMAEPILDWLQAYYRHTVRFHAILLVNTRHTAVRLASFPAQSDKALAVAAQNMMRQSFPYGDHFNEETHVFDYSVFPEPPDRVLMFMAALPAAYADGLAHMCEKLPIGIHRIKRIDTIEHILFRYYCAHSESVWLCVPQEDGMRILSISGALPRGASFISNRPGFCETELTRIWHAQSEAFLPERVVWMGSQPAYAWLWEYFGLRGVLFSEEPLSDGKRFVCMD